MAIYLIQKLVRCHCCVGEHLRLSRDPFFSCLMALKTSTDSNATHESARSQRKSGIEGIPDLEIAQIDNGSQIRRDLKRKIFTGNHGYWMERKEPGDPPDE